MSKAAADPRRSKDGGKENANPGGSMEDSLDSFPTSSPEDGGGGPGACGEEQEGAVGGGGGYSSVLEESTNNSKVGQDGGPAGEAGGRGPPVRRPTGPSSSSRFTCDVCAKCFCSKHSLLLHQRTVHLGARDHPCGLCPHRAKQSANLQRHTWSQHRPEKLIEKYLKGMAERAAADGGGPRTVDRGTAWAEAVAPVYETLRGQLSARNQEDLERDRRFHELLGAAGKLDISGGGGGGASAGAGGGILTPRLLPRNPLPKDQLPSLPALSHLPAPEEDSFSKGAASPAVSDAGLLSVSVHEERSDDGGGEASGVSAVDQAPAAAEVEGPCTRCHGRHLMSKEEHPMVALLREAGEAARAGRRRSHWCDACGEFSTDDGALLLYHHDVVHSFRPAYPCQRCEDDGGAGFVLDSVTELRRHGWLAHGDRCPWCPPDADSPRRACREARAAALAAADLLCEGRNSAGDPILPCVICSSEADGGGGAASEAVGVVDHRHVFLRRDELALHLMKAHARPELVRACCHLCDAEFLDPDDWARHQRWSHSAPAKKK